MNDNELLDAIDGLMAYDLGASDSGINNSVLKTIVIRELHRRDDSVTLLTKHVIELLTVQGKTIADIKELIDWLNDNGCNL